MPQDVQRPTIERTNGQGGYGVILSVAFSPDGKTLAACDGDCEIILYDTATAKERRSVEFNEPFRQVGQLLTYSPDGKTLAVGPTQQGGIKLLDATTCQLRLHLEFPDNIKSFANCLAYSPNGKIVAAGLLSGEVVLWDASTGKRILILPATILPAHSKVFPRSARPVPATVVGLAFAQDGTTLFSNAKGTSVRTFNVGDGTEKQTPVRLDTQGRMSLSPDGKFLAIMEQARLEKDADTGRSTQRLTFWDAPAWEKRAEWIAPSFATHIALLDGGRALLWKEFNKNEISVRDAKDGHVLSSLPLEPIGRITCVTVSPDGRTIALGGDSHAPFFGVIRLIELDGTTLRPWKPKKP